MAGGQRRINETLGVTIENVVDRRCTFEGCSIPLWATRSQKSLRGGWWGDVVEHESSIECVKFHQSVSNGNVVSWE